MMVAKLWCDEIIAGRRKYKNVPAKLKSKVRELLTEKGRSDLIIE